MIHVVWMVEILIEIPVDEILGTELPLRFMQMCAAGEQPAGGLCLEAVARCQELRINYPEQPFVFHLSGIISFLIENHDAAKRFWGEAILADPEYETSRKALTSILEEDDLWPDMAAYMETLAEGSGAFCNEYLKLSHDHFDAHRYREADHLLQRASAHNNPNTSALKDYSACLHEGERPQKAGELEQTLRDAAKNLETYWNSLDSDAIDAANDKFDSLPNRHQLAAMVCQEIERLDNKNPVFFELGCYAGYNIKTSRETLSDGLAKKVGFVGLEPNHAAVAYCRKNYPWLDIRRGTHADMISGITPTPDKVDICLISRVFMIMHPDDITAILDYLAKHTATLIICDDIINIDGKGSLVRGSGGWIMHDFGNLLEQAGFDIRDVIMTDIPDRECTGFIIADNKTSGFP